MAELRQPRHRKDFGIALICALRVELDAVEALFDEYYEDDFTYGKAAGDHNAYTTGRICNHNVVLTYMPGMGKASSASVAASIRASFPGAKLGIVVGICGGVPIGTDDEEILLGDVMVSTGLIQFDFGRQYSNRVARKDTLQDNLGRPNTEIRSFLTKLSGLRNRSRLRDKTSSYLAELCRKDGFQRSTYPGADNDQLYQPGYRHKHQDPNACNICANCQDLDDEVCDIALESSCAELLCEDDKLIPRARVEKAKGIGPDGHTLTATELHEAQKPLIHFGLIASGDVVMKSGLHRDHVSSREKVIAFEMEGAGVWDNFPTIVIKGVCDYADSHKNKKWQRYAAATAAACMKAFLCEWRTADKPLKMSEIPGQIELPRPISTLPFEKDIGFVGREEIIAEIEKRLSLRRRVAIAGIGGVGKSQIAIEYCYRFQAKNPHSSVFWVHAGTPARFQEAYRTIGRKLGLPGSDDPNVNILQLVRDRLSDERHSTWLMVLDNVDDMEIFFATTPEVPSIAAKSRLSLSAYIPRSLNGSFLVTTRDTRVGERLTDRDKCIMVPPLAKQEAMHLLRSKLSESNDCVETDAANLVETLDYLPLAITQAAAFISENHCTVADYVKALQASDSDEAVLLSEDLPDPRRDMDAPSSVVRTWKVSFDLIRNRKPRAAEMLSLAAVLDRQGIPKSLLRRDSDRTIDFMTALGTLQSFSLIDAEKGGETFVMHRLVQICMQSWLEMDNTKQLYEDEAAEALSRSFPNGQHENWKICELLLPHARKIVGYRYNSKVSQLLYATLCHNVSWYDLNRGGYESAFKEVKAAWEVRQKLLGDVDSATLSSLSLLATVLWGQGKFEEAEAMDRRTLDGNEKVLGKEHPDTLTSVSNLALVLGNQGKYEEAEAMNRRALDGREKVLGKEHPDTLTSVNNLALVLRGQGKYEEAEAMNRRALDGFEKALGKEHPYTLISVHCLAYLLHQQKRYEAASELYLRASSGYRMVLGPSHPTTISCDNNYYSLRQEMNVTDGLVEAN